MGDGKKGVLRVAFDKRIRLEFHGAKIASEGGLLLYRELDEALRLTDLDKAVLATMSASTVDLSQIVLDVCLEVGEHGYSDLKTWSSKAPSGKSRIKSIQKK